MHILLGFGLCRTASDSLRSSCLQLAVCAVAERLLATLLAAAEEHPLAGLSCVLDGRYAGVLVATVAERLIAALTTGAPEVAFAFFNFDWVGGFLRDDGCCHLADLICLACIGRGSLTAVIYNARKPSLPVFTAIEWRLVFATTIWPLNQWHAGDAAVGKREARRE